jgi:hypothetical protein
MDISSKLINCTFLINTDTQGLGPFLCLSCEAFGIKYSELDVESMILNLSKWYPQKVSNMFLLSIIIRLEQKLILLL